MAVFRYDSLIWEALLPSVSLHDPVLFLKLYDVSKYLVQEFKTHRS